MMEMLGSDRAGQWNLSTLADRLASVAADSERGVMQTTRAKRPRRWSRRVEDGGQEASFQQDRNQRRRRSSSSLSSHTMRLTTLVACCALLLAATAVAGASASSLPAARPLQRRQAGAIATGPPDAPSEPADAPSEPAGPSTSEAPGAAGEEARGESAANSASTSTSTSTTTEQPPSSTAKPKIPAVNFTQVDERFLAGAEEAEVVAKWRKLDRTLQSGVGQVLKMVFPHVVSMASDAKVSGNCQGAILKWILNLKNLRTWSVKMLDAIGKPSAGLLEGSLTMFGNYKQCLAVRAPDEDEIEIADGEFKEYFRGQYCVLQLKPPLVKKRPFYSLNSSLPALARPSYKYYEKNVYDDLAELAMAFNFVSIRADLCVPSLCARDDIQRVADFLASKLDMRARVQRCDVAPQEEQSMVEQHHLIWALIFVILLLLVLVSTLTSLAFRLNRNKGQLSGSKSIFTSMSVYRSLAHMRNVQVDRINDSKPAFLYAIRVILLLWICLVSLTSQLNFQFLRELLALRSVIMTWPLQLLVNSSLQFDSLILLTAFTYAYQNINANLTDLIKYNVSKYARLMPSIMFMAALTIITPLLYQSRSPVWHDFVDEPAQACKSNGYVNLFFLQNLLPNDQICLPYTWLFCVELQLCLLAIPIVLLLNRTFDHHQGQFKLDSLPVLALIGAALAGCLVNFANLYRNSLPAAWFLTFPDRDDKNTYMGQHLQRTWTHLTTFAVGLLAGHLSRCQSIETFSGRPYGRRCCDNLMWFTSALIMGACIFVTHSWSLTGTGHLEAPVLSALYGALAPLLWSISLSLILFQLTVPNEKNQRSSLTELLTSDVNLIRLGRLSFLAYLINPYVNNFVLAVQEQAIFSSILMLGHTFIGNLVFTFALAFVVSALVELPCRRLVKKLLGSRRHTSNLDIIARQMDSRHHQNADGRAHDSFMAQQKHSYANSGPRQASSAMIPLK